MTDKPQRPQIKYVDIERLCVTLNQASELIGASVGHLRVELSKGNLRARKNGRKVIILRSELERYLNALPEWTPGKAPKAANDARRK